MLQVSERATCEKLQSFGWPYTKLTFMLGAEVTFVTNVIDEGNLPKSVVNAKMKSNLSIVNFVQDLYERNGLQVDKEIRQEFQRTINFAVAQKTAAEEQIVKDQLELSKGDKTELWEVSIKWLLTATSTTILTLFHPICWRKPMDQRSSVFVKISKKHIAGEPINWGRAETTVDASCDTVLSWLWDYCSYERMASQHDLRRNPREVLKVRSAYFIRNHHSIHSLTSNPIQSNPIQSNPIQSNPGHITQPLDLQ